ncbi:hotdog domain-containing protein [Gordonia liuliyuniae]|uniref:Acyl-coenzyme A thioesterase THEM4 n=1 Tax=Gordonia liuliyuniae TaxID=2911517 RepID=A0ABS9IVZ7_9ACTN|nr:hotdog domain-containing protein [Gordonia liuliyuniae]MCF8589738.1 PaaI family thioesterase [Gordonia liuliyuniae]
MDFRFEDIGPAEVKRRISAVEPLTESVRDLVDAVIRTEVDDTALDDARRQIDDIVARLRTEEKPGGFGVPFTRDLVGMPWGNAATGVRNAIAPPLRPVTHAGVSTAEVTLGAAYEGPGGHVHGGVLALLLDQLVGECASSGTSMPHFTGTLTVRYVRPTKLGQVSLRAEVTGTQDRKAFVSGEIHDSEGVTAEVEAIMIRPKEFAGRDEVMAAIAEATARD